MSQKIQELINNIELIQQSFTEPTSVAIIDTEKYLIQLPASFDKIKMPPGTPLNQYPIPLLEDSLKTGKVNRMEMFAEECGVGFTITWNPIIEDKKLLVY